MPLESASEQQIIEHGWCLQLMGSQAFGFFLAEMQRRERVAQRNVSHEAEQNRDYQAGRLSAFMDAQRFVEAKYTELKPIVERVSS